MTSRWLVLAVVGVLCACRSDPPASPPDASPPEDATVAPDASAPTPLAPALPRFLPCPDGWSTTSSEHGVEVCEPFSAATPDDCAQDEAIWPGETACTRIAPDCPLDGFPTDLPATDVVFLRAGETSGDGSRATPFGTLTEALAAVPPGGTVAIAPGAYEGGVRIDEDVALVGACLDVVIGSTGLPALTTQADLELRHLRLRGYEGVLTRTGGSITARGVVIEDTTLRGVSALGGSFDGELMIVRRTGDFAFGATTGTTMALRRSMIVDTELGAFDISGITLEVEAVATLRVGLPQFESPVITIYNAANASFSEVSIAESGSDQVYIAGADTVSFQDVVFEARAAGERVEGGGLFSFGGADVTLRRVRLERLRELALAVADDGAVLRIEDVLIADLQTGELGIGGRGIEIGASATLDATRMMLVGARDVGILTDGSGATVDARDLTIRDTRSNEAGTMGRAVQVQSGASLTLERASITGSREVGVVVATSGSQATLLETVIEGTLPRECADDGCPPAGIGAAAYTGGALRLSRFAVRANALAGIQIAADGEVDLVDGEVTDQPVGVNLQVEGYDLDRLTAGVFYRRNGVNLDSTSLPIPEATVPSAGP